MRIDAILTPKPNRRRTALAAGLLAALAASATAAVTVAAAQAPADAKPLVSETRAAGLGPIDTIADRPRTDAPQPITLAAAAPAPARAPAAAKPPISEKTAARMGPIDIIADRLQTDAAHHTSLWSGDASVSGITKANMDGLFIDGRAATEADLATLPQRRFASIKATFNPNGHELDRLDAQTKP